MYEVVTPYPEGDSTVARCAVTAGRRGYDGIVVQTVDATHDPGRIQDVSGVDVVDAVEITADDPSKIAGHLGTYREEKTIVMVRGGDPTVNRYAVEEPRVDVLTAPMQDTGDINHVLATKANRNDVRLEFRFAPVLRSVGGPRVEAISRLRKLKEIVDDGDAPFVVSAAPNSHLQFREVRDLVAVGAVIGFDESLVRDGLAEWGVIAEQNRSRQSEAVPESGVHVSADPTSPKRSEDADSTTDEGGPQ